MKASRVLAALFIGAFVAIVAFVFVEIRSALADALDDAKAEIRR